MTPIETPILTPETCPWPEAIIAVLERQRGLVEQLDGLAQQQASLIESNATDHLLNLLSRRQHLIDDFTASQIQLAQLTQNLDERLHQAAQNHRDEINSLIAQIGDRLAEVMRRDEHDHAALRSTRDAVQQELSGMGSARQARSAYVNTSSAPTRFADQRG